MTTIADKLEPEVLPAYVPSDVLNGEAREEAMRMMHRLAGHVRNKTTDQAEGNWQEPVENYGDEALFQAELETLFKRIPLPLALTCEIPEKNSYKALLAVGVPVVITRDAKGAGARHAQRVPAPWRAHLRGGAGLGPRPDLPVPRVVVRHGR